MKVAADYGPYQKDICGAFVVHPAFAVVNWSRSTLAATDTRLRIVAPVRDLVLGPAISAGVDTLSG